MHTLRWIRMLLTLCGCMQPPSWSSPTKKFIYNVYTVSILLTVYSTMIFQILDAILIVDNADDFIDNCFVTVATVVSSYKVLYFLVNRESFKALIDTLSREPFLPTNQEETEIRDKFNELSEWNAVVYTVLIEICANSLWMTTIIHDFSSRKLTYRAWIPYNYYSSLFLFIVTFCHQALGVTFASLFNVTFDTFFSGLLIHTSCQFEILRYRLNNITKDGYKSAKQCVRHHESIYKFSIMVNQGFKSILGAQLLASLFLICFTLYRLTQDEFGIQFMESLFFLLCIIVEILYYCWYGNEVKLKSLEVSDMIFASNWTSLNISTKKVLLMIMRRATTPIDYNSLFVVSMDLASFTTLLKISYSTYNMLLNTKN